MRLVPTPERVQLLGFALASAQQLFPGVEILAVCAMSNHLHLVVHDRDAELSDFMQHFLSALAVALNALDGLHGPVFERRFAEIPILDEVSLFARVAYAVANPVEADLVRTHRDWTGLVMFAGRVPWRRTFSRFNEPAYLRALDRADVSRSAFYETATLQIQPVDDRLARGFEQAIKDREAELRREQASVVGMEKVLEMPALTRPKGTARSPMPLCFARSREAWLAFRDAWRSWCAAFYAASERFRGGELTAAFPVGAFRPSCFAG